MVKLYQIICISNADYILIQDKVKYDFASFVIILVHNSIYILIPYLFSLLLHNSND